MSDLNHFLIILIPKHFHSQKVNSCKMNKYFGEPLFWVVEFLRAAQLVVNSKHTGVRIKLLPYTNFYLEVYATK